MLLLITNLHWHCVTQIYQRMMINSPARPAGRAEPLPPAKPKYSYVRAQRCTTRWPLRPVLGSWHMRAAYRVPGHMGCCTPRRAVLLSACLAQT